MLRESHNVTGNHKAEHHDKRHNERGQFLQDMVFVVGKIVVDNVRERCLLLVREQLPPLEREVAGNNIEIDAGEEVGHKGEDSTTRLPKGGRATAAACSISA